jgi:hypothetical protein
MLSEYIFELDSKTTAQIVTLIGGIASLFHYLAPKRSALRWGLWREEAHNPIVLWLIQRTGLINCQMALACLLTFFYNFSPTDTIVAVFVTWSLDSFYTAMFRTIPGGTNNAMHKRGHWINFLLSTTAILLHYWKPQWGDEIAAWGMGWALFNGLLFTLLPSYGLYQWGLPNDRRGYNEALCRIHGGSLMQVAAFGFLMMKGVDSTRALSRAMMLQAFQFCLSRFVLHEDDKLGLDKSALSFWILFYIPAIGSLWF